MHAHIKGNGSMEPFLVFLAENSTKPQEIIIEVIKPPNTLPKLHDKKSNMPIRVHPALMALSGMVSIGTIL